MARKLFIVAMLLLACAVGVIGFQILNYLIVGAWPSVPVQYVWSGFFAGLPDSQSMGLNRMSVDMAAKSLGWFGRVPMAVALIAMSYAVFFISDVLRRR